MPSRPLRTPRERVGTLPNAVLPPPDSASPLLDRALLSGDEAAFNEAVRHLEPAMLRAAMLYVRSRDDAHDAVQETWIAALEGIARFEGRSTLRTWLFRILSFRARAVARRSRRTVPLSQLGYEGDALPGRPLFDRLPAQPDALLIAKEVRRRIASALRDMPRSQRHALLLRARGYSAGEVSDRLRVSGANERVLLHRARARVRREFIES